MQCVPDCAGPSARRAPEYFVHFGSRWSPPLRSSAPCRNQPGRIISLCGFAEDFVREGRTTTRAAAQSQRGCDGEKQGPQGDSLSPWSHGASAGAPLISLRKLWRRSVFGARFRRCDVLSLRVGVRVGLRVVPGASPAGASAGSLPSGAASGGPPSDCGAAGNSPRTT